MFFNSFELDEIRKSPSIPLPKMLILKSLCYAEYPPMFHVKAKLLGRHSLQKTLVQDYK